MNSPKDIQFSKRQPPRWAERLLEWFCAPHLLEEVQGDLHELYGKWMEQYGVRKARWLYVIHAIKFLRPYAIKRNKNIDSVNATAMLKNYLKIAFRNLQRDRTFSMINVGGLAIGLASCIILLLFVADELSYDRFYAKKDQLYLVWMNQKGPGGEISTNETTPNALAEAILNNVPEVVNTGRWDWGGEHLLAYDDKSIKKNGNYADPSILRMFSFNLLEGDPETALDDPHAVVLTQSVAQALFGEEDPLGKIVRMDERDDMKITGIAADPPYHSTLQFDFLLPWQYAVNLQHGVGEPNWRNFSFRTFVELTDNASATEADKKIRPLVQQHSEQADIELMLQPFVDWHLYSEFKNGIPVGGRIEYVRLFLILAAGILLIACINFINLSTARSEKRAREVGIRKMAGAGRTSLIGQFIGESIVLSALSLMVAVLLVHFTLPYFNQIFDKHLTLEYGNPYYWSAGLILIIFTGLLAGSYPAFYLSGLNPLRIFKSNLRFSKSALRPRQVLVVFQFVAAIVFTLGTLIIYQQIQFIKEKPIGYDIANLVEVPIEGNLYGKSTILREELLKTGAIEDLCILSNPMVGGWTSTFEVEWPGKQPDDKISFVQLATAYHFSETYGVEIVEGRDFSEDYASDSSAILLNEAAVVAMGLSNPVGAKVKWQHQFRTVVGVFKDFIKGSPYQPVQSMIIGFAPQRESIIALRLENSRSISDNLAQLERVFKKHNPAYPFQYSFVDARYEQKFAMEKMLGHLSGLFAGLTLFISCLGLLGLTAFTAMQRTKEIGIRKVLGASVASVVALLSKDFIKLVLIALLMATPIAWYVMNRWLQNFAYRIELQWWMFVLAGLLAVLIALLTVSFQSVKAALINPVKTLRNE